MDGGPYELPAELTWLGSIDLNLSLSGREEASIFELGFDERGGTRGASNLETIALSAKRDADAPDVSRGVLRFEANLFLIRAWTALSALADFDVATGDGEEGFAAHATS